MMPSGGSIIDPYWFYYDGTSTPDKGTTKKVPVAPSVRQPVLQHHNGRRDEGRRVGSRCAGP